MARVIVTGGKGKRYSREGGRVMATVGVVSGTEYYELQVVAEDGVLGDSKHGYIRVTKSTSKDPEPKEVYRVPSRKKVRKKTPQEPSAPTLPGITLDPEA